MNGQINELEVAKARHELKSALNRWPSLRGDPDDCSEDDWMDILKGEGMADNNQGTQIGARLDARMIEGIDRFAARLTSEIRNMAPGLTISRSEALRMLLERALRQEGILAVEKIRDAQEVRQDEIMADLLAGNYTSQRELAERYTVNQSTVSRLKARLLREGRL